ncbi:hypothetical protein B7486_12995 [cyanobacterium TDX16]|nr:hypothetical protein B7486_12995 [cyanobacterium TDX16]
MEYRTKLEIAKMSIARILGTEASPAISAKLDEIVLALGLQDGDVSDFDLDSESGIMKFLDAVLAGLQHNARGMTASASMSRSQRLAASAAEWASSTDAQRLCDLEAWQDQTLRDAGLPLMTDSEREIYAGS